MFRPNRSRFLETPHYEDVTELLELGTKELKIGELFHTESFSLVEAMSVIEIMDPKMDSGMNWQDTEGEPFFSNFDVMVPITLQQLLGILDDLFCCEQTWYTGYGLSHTIYICQYVHSVSKLPYFSAENTENSNLLGTLKAYIITTLHCSHIIWSEMIKGHVQDEEDFVTSRAGLPFYSDTSVQEGKDLLAQTIGWVKTKSDSLWSDLLTRLESRCSYLDALNDLSQPCCFKYNQAEKSLRNCSTLVSDFKSSFSSPTGAFDSRIVRNFNSNAPPRHVEILKMASASSYFLKLLDELIFVCKTITYSSIWDLTYSLFNFSQQPASPVARSWLCSTIYQDRQCFGHFGTNPLGLEHIEALCPWTRTLYLHNDTHQMLNEFIKVFSQFMLHFYLTRCRNRPRQRRTLCKLLIALNQLESEASHISPFFQTRLESSQSTLNDLSITYEFSTLGNYRSGNSWLNNVLEPLEPKNESISDNHQFPHISLVALIERLKLNIMVEVLTSGFSLELYGLHERASVLHYVSYILDCQIVFYINILKLYEFDQSKIIYWFREQVQTQTEITLYSRLILEYLHIRMNLYLSSASFILLTLMEQKGLHPNPFPSKSSASANNDLTKFEEEYQRLQNDELKFEFRYSMFSSINRPSPLKYNETVTANQAILFYPSSSLSTIALKQFESALQLCQSLHLLSISHPGVFAAEMCPAVPSNNFSATIDVIQTNIFILNKNWSGLIVQLDDPIAYYPSWVPRLSIKS